MPPAPLEPTLESLTIQNEALQSMLYVARSALMFSCLCPKGENTVAALARQSLASMDSIWETCTEQLDNLVSS